MTIHLLQNARVSSLTSGSIYCVCISPSKDNWGYDEIINSALKHFRERFLPRFLVGKELFEGIKHVGLVLREFVKANT